MPSAAEPVRPKISARSTQTPRACSRDVIGGRSARRTHVRRVPKLRTHGWSNPSWHRGCVSIVQLGWDTTRTSRSPTRATGRSPWTPARSPRFACVGGGRSRPGCGGDRRGSTRARCSPAKTDRSCIRQRSPTGSRHSPPRRSCPRSDCTISVTVPHRSCWPPGWPRRSSRRRSGTRRSCSPSTPTPASTTKSRPRPPRPRWRSFRERALLHTHRIHTRHRAPREDQKVPGQTVGRVGLEPTT